LLPKEKLTLEAYSKYSRVSGITTKSTADCIRNAMKISLIPRNLPVDMN